MYGDSSKTPFLFNGMYGVMSDSNNLYYMRARFYSPDIRRFVNRDVLIGDVGSGQSLNRFAFVNSNPISYVDPEGKFAVVIPPLVKVVFWGLGSLGVWTATEVIFPQKVPFNSGQVAASYFPDIFALAGITAQMCKNSVATGTLLSTGWTKLLGGVRIKQVGNYWIKEVDPNASKFAQWWGKSSLDAQAKGLDKLDNMAPAFLYKNNKIVIRDAGKYELGNFWKIWFEGSKRLNTPFNDIRPRNIGINGIIFDPSKHPIQESLEWFTGAALIGSGAYLMCCDQKN